LAEAYLKYSVFSGLDIKPTWLSGNASDLYQECLVRIPAGIPTVLTDFFVVFLSPSRHNCLLPNRFQFISHCHVVIWRYWLPLNELQRRNKHDWIFFHFQVIGFWVYFHFYLYLFLWMQSEPKPELSNILVTKTVMWEYCQCYVMMYGEVWLERAVHCYVSPASHTE
jgi:hypothetical protein